MIDDRRSHFRHGQDARGDHFREDMCSASVACVVDLLAIGIEDQVEVLILEVGREGRCREGAEPAARDVQGIAEHDAGTASDAQSGIGTGADADHDAAQSFAGGLGVFEQLRHRGHQSLANLGLFPSAYFIPEWVSGTASLRNHRDCEKTSKSRRRDRAILKRGEISYSVTRKLSDLEYFYEKMYLPLIEQKHGNSEFVMTGEQMDSRLRNDDAQLIMIHQGEQAVGGSLIIQENGLPRLYSQGVLNNDKNLMRLGVGTAIYLYSFDYLLNEGYSRVNMGWSRALLTDGSLYFKQRFGLVVQNTSPIGHFLKHAPESRAASECLAQTGFLQHLRGKTSAVLFGASDSDRDAGLVAQKKMQCESMGIDQVTTIDLKRSKQGSAYRKLQEKRG